MSFLERLRPAGTRAGFPVMAGALPFIGHAPILHLDAGGAVARAHAALGPLFWVHLGFGNWYLFCGGPGSFEFLRHPAVGVAGGRSSLEYILGKSLLTLDGAEHRRVRGVMNPPFAPHGLGEGAVGASVAEVVTARARRWAGLERIPVHDEMKEMTLDVIFRVAGVAPGDIGHRPFRLTARSPSPDDDVTPGARDAVFYLRRVRSPALTPAERHGCHPREGGWECLSKVGLDVVSR